MVGINIINKINYNSLMLVFEKAENVSLEIETNNEKKITTNFTKINNEVLDYLKNLNSNYEPICEAYAGMGHVYVLVSDISHQSFYLTMMGGSNGYDRDSNINDYKSGQNFDLVKSIKYTEDK